MLEDGTSFGIWSLQKGCTNGVQQKTIFKKHCATLYIDLNNVKGPNRLGIDMFEFVLTEKNIVPAGTGIKNLYINTTGRHGQCKYGELNEYNGTYCGPHVLYKGNMDYLHKNIEDEWQ